MEWAKTQTGALAHVVRAFAEAMEVVPFTLAENAGMRPITIVTGARRALAAAHLPSLGLCTTPRASDRTLSRVHPRSRPAPHPPAPGRAVTPAELRKQHAEGNAGAGIDVRRGRVSDMYEENVVQPLRTTLSALQLSTETVRMILKIDDMVPVR